MKKPFLSDPLTQRGTMVPPTVSGLTVSIGPCETFRDVNEAATVALWATTIDALRTTRKMTISRNFITMRV